ncbi:MAG: S1 RNA-binding domain-containing protein [Candidatus Mcinerneyibacterium aminivorans]|uniref:S1 RNA-binding domain-containing protein n=1 Tax=Candidatus Mcinerneyibacterium aminivorans TaxID=2703815 RepID=A0A5D0MGQ5_9BACT|nr:MAG: S1 RNA-binding domain-containing protein [Candidatus Mcinerneyibacterium aminivorans]
MIIEKLISDELNIENKKVVNTTGLLKDGNTIPFISRYRKEITGNMQETEIREIAERLKYYEELQNRKKYILKTIKNQGKLTNKLKEKIRNCYEKNELEDLYLPYKPKKRTKAEIAKENGFEPLAKIIYRQKEYEKNKNETIFRFKNEDESIVKKDEIIKQVRYILASYINDNHEVRKKLRKLYDLTGVISTKEKKIENDEKGIYRDYYDYKEKINTIKSHRLLAINRAENEKIIKVNLEVDEDEAIDIIKKIIIKNKKHIFHQEMLDAIELAYFGYLHSSLENEIRNKYTEIAESTAIDVFEKNLESLLLSPPASDKNIIGVDPGLRTGSKAAIIDKRGNYLDHFVIDSMNESKFEGNVKIFLNNIEKHNIDIIAIGNGKGSNDIVQIIKSVKSKLQKSKKIDMVVVNESGASIYSASDTAVKEFPDLDVTIRGAISIARRVHDPLSEFVKIDPKSLGIGQYQHDVDQKELQRRLNVVVSSVVNRVGVDINSSSEHLLSYVSGISDNLAEKIINYRNKNTEIKNREELKNVKGIGPKTYKQCSGFIRIRNGDNILDNTAIHPENYKIVEKILKENCVSKKELLEDKNIVKKIDFDKYKKNVGEYTIEDIKKELKKPGRDIRDDFEPVPYSDKIESIDDLKTNMVIAGTITNITNFGLFIDLGIGVNGLCHISQTIDKYVEDLSDYFSVGEWHYFKVLEIDSKRERISLALDTKNKNDS